MNEKLTYEEWRVQNVPTVIVSDEARRGLKEHHDINADAEVERAIRKEYEAYINGGVE